MSRPPTASGSGPRVARGGGSSSSSPRRTRSSAGSGGGSHAASPTRSSAFLTRASGSPTRISTANDVNNGYSSNYTRFARTPFNAKAATKDGKQVMSAREYKLLTIINTIMGRRSRLCFQKLSMHAVQVGGLLQTGPKYGGAYVPCENLRFAKRQWKRDQRGHVHSDQPTAEWEDEVKAKRVALAVRMLWKASGGRGTLHVYMRSRHTADAEQAQWNEMVCSNRMDMLLACLTSRGVSDLQPHIVQNEFPHKSVAAFRFVGLSPPELRVQDFQQWTIPAKAPLYKVETRPFATEAEAAAASGAADGSQASATAEGDQEGTANPRRSSTAENPRRPSDADAGSPRRPSTAGSNAGSNAGRPGRRGST